MRQVRYAVASSVDGYIAGPRGEADWIIMGPDIDFQALLRRFDTALMGRRTFEWMVQAGATASLPGVTCLVCSRTMKQGDYPDVTVVSDVEATVTALKQAGGKDIWLFGGGLLFRSLAETGLVDTVEVAIIPVLLGAGIPLLPPPARELKLKLRALRVYGSGIVSLEYAVSH